VVQEERLGERARVLEDGSRDRQAGPGDEPRLARERLAGAVLRGPLDGLAAAEGLSRAAGPRDARELDDAAAAVDDAAPLRRDQPLPRRPPALLREGELDGVAEPGRDDGVGIQEQQQLSGRKRRAPVRRRREPEVLSGLDQGRPGRGLANRRERLGPGCVVDDDQLVAGSKLVGERAQRPANRLALVMGNDDDGECGQRQPSASRTRAVSPQLSASAIMPSRNW
jgi:hypothetical protein